MNEIRITGKICKPGVALGFLPSGAATAKFSIARSWQTKKGEWKTEFFRVVVHGDLAERISDMQGVVLVKGRLRQERWQKDGKPQSTVFIAASSVEPYRRGGEEDSDVPF